MNAELTLTINAIDVGLIVRTEAHEAPSVTGQRHHFRTLRIMLGAWRGLRFYGIDVAFCAPQDLSWRH